MPACQRRLLSVSRVNALTLPTTQPPEKPRGRVSSRYVLTCFVPTPRIYSLHILFGAQQKFGESVMFDEIPRDDGVNYSDLLDVYISKLLFTKI